MNDDKETDEESFVQEILAVAADRHEDADAARLVYADWLEERGDARADFIRIEHEAAQLHPASERYWELKPRRRELRATIDEAWLHRLGYEVVYHPLFTKLPETRRERWRLVEEFVEYWQPRPLEPEDGSTEEEILAAERRLGTRLPTALREWYALSGRRTDIWSQQARLLELENLRWEQGLLIFRHESHTSPSGWGIAESDMALDDPPIRPPEPEEGRSIVTEFAIQEVLLESMWINRRGMFDDGLASARAYFTPCDLPARFHMTFHEGRDIYYFGLDSGGLLVARNEKVVKQLPPGLRSVFRHLETSDS